MEADLLARCKQHKQKVIDRYGWNHDCLPQSFATEVAKLLEREIDTDISMIPDTAIERRSTYQYCQYLYHASKGTQEPCQHKALVAIHKFVYEIILNVSHHNQWLAEDVAQNTILTTYQKLDSVKNPGLFLAWIKQIGVREFYKALRDEKRQLGISPFGILTYLDEIENPGTVTTEPFEESEEENGDGEDNDSTETRNSRLQDILKRCLRSKKQQKAIVLLFIEEMGMKQAAKTLGITPSYLRGLKHRAIKKLRTCQELFAMVNIGPNTSEAHISASEVTQARHLVHAIQESGSESSLSCEACRELLPEYVEAEMADEEDVPAKYPHVKAHLDLCQACEAEYTMMLEFSAVAERMTTPDLNAVPIPDLSFLPALTLAAYVRFLVESLIPKLIPSEQAGSKRLLDLFFEGIQTWTGQQMPTVPAGLGSGGSRDQLRITGATYGAIRSIQTQVSPEDVRQLHADGALAELVRTYAQQAASQQELPPELTAQFVAQFTERVSKEPGILFNLAQG